MFFVLTGLMEAVFQGVQYDSVTNLQLLLSTLMEKVYCAAHVIGITLDAISLATLRCFYFVCGERVGGRRRVLGFEWKSISA